MKNFTKKAFKNFLEKDKKRSFKLWDAYGCAGTAFAREALGHENIFVFVSIYEDSTKFGKTPTWWVKFWKKLESVDKFLPVTAERLLEEL